MQRNRWLLGITVLVLMTVLMAGGSAWAADEIVIAQGVDATTMIPNMQSITSTNNVLEHIFDTLVWRDENLNIIPALAKSWETPDEVTWDFHLRDDVTWHDGQPFTAADVKYTLDFILDESVGSQYRPYHVLIESIEVLDDHTVRMVTYEPHPLMLARLSMTQIFAQHHMEAHSMDYLASNPIGTGPYRLAEWVRDERVVLERCEDHWRGPAGVERIIFRPIPESSTRIAELSTGNVDIIVNVPPHQISTVENSPNARIESVPSVRVIFLGINTEPEGPLQDSRVRRALNYALNREILIEAILEGLGQPLAPGGLSNFHFGYDPSIEPFPYDPERAQELMADAGYPDGFPLHMMIPDGRYAMDREVGEAIVGMLRNIGLTVTYDVMEWGVYVNHINERKLSDLYLLGWGGATVDAEGTFGPLLYSGNPLSYFSNAEVDALIDRGRTTVDAEERQAIYSELSHLLAEEAPWVYLHQQVDVYGLSSQLDWQPRSDERLWMYHAQLR